MSEDLEGVRKTGLDLAMKYYPEVKCVILTGSIVESEYVSQYSDIDILLIDNVFKGVSSEAVSYKSYKIDFTRVNSSNLLLILLDHSYSSNSVLLDMIYGGIILKDATGIGEVTKRFVNKLFIGSNKNSYNDSRNLVHGLIKLKKHLPKKLDQSYNLFLLGDFIKLMASCYLFFRDNGKIANDGFRLVKKILIKEKNPVFLDYMVDLSQGFLIDPAGSKNIMIAYINMYVDLFARLLPKVSFEKRLIVNISFLHQSREVFYKTICVSILNHPYVAKYFIIGELNSYKYIFKNDYCLIFNKDLSFYDEIFLLKELELIFLNETHRILDLNIIDPSFLYELLPNTELNNSIEELVSFINKKTIGIIQLDGGYNSNKIFLLGIVISIRILKAFNLTIREIVVLSDFLIEKWAPDDIYHSVSFDEIQLKHEEIYSDFVETYFENKLIMDEISENYIMNLKIDDEDIDLLAIDELCSELVNKINKNAVEDNSVIFNFSLIDIDELADSDKVTYWYLVHALELVINTLSLDKRQKSYFAFVLGRIFSS